MTEDDIKPPYKRHPIAVVSVLLVLFFGVSYGIGFYMGVFPNILDILLNPVVGVSVSLIFLIIVALGGIFYLRNRGSGGLFGSGGIAEQLTKKEADVLATRWHRNRGFLARRTPMDGVDYVESEGGDESNHARIYEKVIYPKTDAYRKCILINLEQEVSVDVDDRGSVDRAIDEMNDAIFFSEDTVDNFNEARKEYKQNLAGSSTGETEIIHRPDGTKVRRNVQERTISSAETEKSGDAETAKQEG